MISSCCQICVPGWPHQWSTPPTWTGDPLSKIYRLKFVIVYVKYIAISHPLSILFLVLLDSILFVLSELQVEYKLNLEPEVIALGALCILTDKLKWQSLLLLIKFNQKNIFSLSVPMTLPVGVVTCLRVCVLWPMTLVCLPASATYTTPDDCKGCWEGYVYWSGLRKHVVFYNF